YVRTWSMADGQARLLGGLNLPRPLFYPVLSGPEPGTLLIGQSVVDLMSGQPIMQVPGTPHQWAGRDRLLAVTNVFGAVNSKRIQDAVDYNIGLGIFLTEFKRDAYQQNATAFAAKRVNLPVNRPPTAPTDRSATAMIQPKRVA